MQKDFENELRIDFATSNRILFGRGKVGQLPELIKGFGKKAFLVRSKSIINHINIDAFFNGCEAQRIEHIQSGEPDIESIQKMLSLARQERCDFVIAIGGGSVIDSGKALAALLANSGELMDYLEVVGLGKKLKQPSKKFIAIPTTAGTGSEVTRNAVISVPQKKVKVSMRSAYMLPDVALIDPELTYSVPAGLTACTGMDALVQVIEPYVSISANVMVDLFCQDAIPRAARCLQRAYQNGDDHSARDQMAWVSLMGGLSLANAGLGAAHGFAGPIGGMFAAPHGAICAAVMSGVMHTNIQALVQREPESPFLKRYDNIARWLTGKNSARAKEGADWIADLCKLLRIPRLNELGIEKTDFMAIVEKAENSSSMRSNSIKLSKQELLQILEMSY